MPDPIGVAIAALAVSVPLASKFQYLRTVLNKDAKDGPPESHNVLMNLTTRLELWGQDICGSLETHESTPNQVLQVIEDDQPGSPIVKKLHTVFDKLLSFVEPLSKGSMEEINPTLGAFYELSDSVQDIRRAFTHALERPFQNVVLCLDGGGIRSFSSILILQAIMKEVHILVRGDPKHVPSTEIPVEKESLPRDYFDYIFGTSSGGLLAIMLGRLRMPISDTITAFSKYSSEVFDHPRPQILTVFPLAPRFSSQRVERAIKELLGVKEIDPAQPWKRNTFVVEGDPCRTGVFAFKKNLKTGTEQLHLFRSYDSALELSSESTSPGPGAKEPTWLIARAIAAAPTYFEPVTIDGFIYQDAGFGLNNPSMEAILEVTQRSEDKPPTTKPSQSSRAPPMKESVALVISIGTGMRKTTSIFLGHSLGFSNYLGLLQGVVNMATDSERNHDMTQRLCQTTGIQYFRFNVDQGLENVYLDDQADSTTRTIGFWSRTGKTARTLEHIEAVTREYLERSDVRKATREAAAALVAKRRPRVPPPIKKPPNRNPVVT